jgi:hypothetical protein
VEEEIDAVLADNPPPVEWLDKMPKTRAAFEEAMRLYPPAPSINREPDRGRHGHAEGRDETHRHRRARPCW